MSDLKTQQTSASVDDFLNRIPEETRRSDCLALAALITRVTGAEPRMWGESIVGYGLYHYHYASGRQGDWMRVGFSPRKGALTVYLVYGFENLPAAQRLGKFKTGKACLYVKKLSDVDQAALAELIRIAWDHAGMPPDSTVA